MKTCSCCRMEKPIAEFYNDAKRKDGKYPSCKLCHSKRAKDWSDRNPEARAEISRNAYLRNPQKRHAQAKAWRLRNPDKYLASLNAWKESNPGWQAEYDRKVQPSRNSIESKRRARKLNATPVWANEFFLEEAFHLAKLRTIKLGIRYHVDHIVPLRSNLVCGLHSETNIQVIPATDNIRKSNRTWPQMP